MPALLKRGAKGLTRALIAPFTGMRHGNRMEGGSFGGVSDGRRLARRALLMSVALLAARSGGAPAAAEVLVYRTMMPECGPSSFAVALTPDLGFSFDPGRGGINYVWQGEFVDLGPTWKAKINKPADLRGAIVYRENVRYPLRFGTAGREPTFEFKGYTVSAGAVEFHYLADGVFVREEIRATPNGSGLIRRFQVSEPMAAWSYSVEPQAGATVSSPIGQWNEGRTALVAPRGREFSVQIDLKPAQP